MCTDVLRSSDISALNKVVNIVNYFNYLSS